MIQELIAQGLTREEIVTTYVEQLSITRSEAEFIYAIETGEIDGDVITDEDEAGEDAN